MSALRRRCALLEGLIRFSGRVYGCAHIIGDTLYRKPRNRIKTFLKDFWKFFSGATADAKRSDIQQLAGGMLATTVTLRQSSSTGPKLPRSSRAKISCQRGRL